MCRVHSFCVYAGMISVSCMRALILCLQFVFDVARMRTFPPQSLKVSVSSSQSTTALALLNQSVPINISTGRLSCTDTGRFTEDGPTFSVMLVQPIGYTSWSFATLIPPHLQRRKSIRLRAMIFFHKEVEMVVLQEPESRIAIASTF